MDNTVNITFWTSMKLHETPCLTTAHKAAHATNCASSQFWGGKTINDRDSAQGNTIWLWHCQFAMERSTMLLSSVNHLFRLGPSIPWRTVSHNQRVMDIKQINSGWNNNMAMNERTCSAFWGKLHELLVDSVWILWHGISQCLSYRVPGMSSIDITPWWGQSIIVYI